MAARRRPSPLVVAALLALALALVATAAGASLVVPVADDDLIVHADVVVLGQVTRIESHLDVTDELSTYVTVAIEEVLKGALPGAEITVKELGGRVGDRMAWVFANPQFEVGERVVLFMDQRDDGTLRTLQFFQGKFTVVTDPATGDLVAARGLPRHVTVLAPRGAAAASAPAPTAAAARRLDDFTRRIREKAAEPRPQGAARQPRALPFASAQAPLGGAVQASGSFTLLQDGGDAFRWNEPDSNEPVVLRIYETGEPAAPTLGFDQIRAAMRIWGRVPTSSFRFAEGPVITEPGLGGFQANGVSSIAFRDPLGQISFPFGCTGTLAIAGISSATSAGGVTVNGRSFFRALEGDLVVADGWEPCGDFYQDVENFTEVITHELGHVLGLDHSGDTSADGVNLGLKPNGTARSGATMRAVASFDGRGAALHRDDRAGVTFIYPGRSLTILKAGPGAGTITSDTDGIDCGAACVAGFALNSTVTLTATAAPGSTFVGFLEAGCGLSVVMSQGRTCTAMFLTDADLQMTAVSAPTVATPGATITVTNTVRNAGLDAGPFSVGIYLSNSSTITTLSPPLATRSLAGLAFEQTSTDATQVTIPADTPSGTYFIGAVADVADEVFEGTLEGNNARAAAGSLVIGRPDLRVTALTAPARVATGANVSVSATVGNLATANVPAPPSTLAFYLSSDPTLDGADRRLAATRDVPQLNRNQTSAAATVLTIPADLATGAYYLIAKADDLDAAAEEDEANNTRATTAAVAIRRPDLRVTSVTAPAAAAAGASVTVRHVVRNAAAAPGNAGASTSRLFLSSDDTFGGDVALGTVPVGPVAAGSQITVTGTVQVPGNTSAGTYWIFAQANALDTIVEEGAQPSSAQPDNVKGTAAAIVVGPDLTVTAATPSPAATAPGLIVNVGHTVRNQGGAPASPFTVRIYLSRNASFEPGEDALVGSRAVPAGLAAGASSAASTPVTIPMDADGAYVLIVRADDPGVVTEANEGNNDRATAQVRVAKADLAVTAVTATPAATAPGANVSVVHVVRNLAAAPGTAGPSVSRLFLSADQTLDGGDGQLGADIPVGALAGGAQASLRQSVQVPPATPPGLYWIFARANATGAVPEAAGAPANNDRSTATPLVVGPDLVVSAATVAPTASAPGLTVSVRDTVRNQGGQAAGPFTVAVYLSTDPDFDDGSDVLLASRTVAAGLAPAATSAAVTPVTLPGGLAPGTYYLVVRADSAGSAPGDVAEGDETNNLRAVPLAVVRPDLRVLSITAPAAGAAGANVSVTHVVRNVAAAAGAAPSTISRLYLSADQALDGADVQLGADVPVAALRGGTQASLTRSLQLPPGTTPGAYFILAVADAADAAVESDETNNQAARSLVVGPDVTLTGASTVSGAIPGATVKVAYTLRNVGGAPAGPFDVGFALVPVTPAGADVPAGPTRTAVVLGAGASLAGSTSIVIPAGIAAGQYRIRVVADTAGAVAEALEDNNAAVTGIVTITPPDLDITALTVPAAGVAGRRIGIPNSVRNAAAAPGTAPAFQVGLYLGDSADIDPAGDVLLAARALASLAPGGVSTATTTVTLPTVPGSYFIGAVADRSNVVVEANEGNNTEAGAIDIVPEMLRTRAASASVTTSDCTLPVNETTLALSGTLRITSHTGTAWKGTVSLPSNSVTLAGTVDTAGIIGGTFTVVNSGGARGGGVFSGSVDTTPGGGFAASFSGAFNVGETCTISASLSAP